MIYVTGDIHGIVYELQDPKLDCLTLDDYVVVTGDCGIPFGYNSPRFKEDKFEEDCWVLRSLPFNVIFVCGNHDDYDFIETLPQINKFNNNKVRQMIGADSAPIYNVFYIDSPGIYDIADKHCLIIPGADSHDIWDGILDPADPDFEEKLFEWSNQYKMFRIKHWTWWPQEAIDEKYIQDNIADWMNDHFDLVFSHDCPTIYNQSIRSRYPDTSGEQALQDVYRVVPFDMWFHGHMHTDRWYRDNIACVYYQYVNVDEMDRYNYYLIREED